jgi:hypothetical protein
MVNENDAASTTTLTASNELPGFRRYSLALDGRMIVTSCETETPEARAGSAQDRGCYC